MPKGSFFSLLALILLGIILFAPGTAEAQQTNPYTQSPQQYCPALVQRALFELGNNCAGLAQGYACYGFPNVSARFYDASLSSLFSQPADRVVLSALQTLQTSPLNLTTAQWGIGVMHIHSNLPNSPPDDGVVALLLGDVRVDNAVEAENILQSAAPIAVVTRINVSMHSGPSLEDPVIGTVPAGIVLQATALSLDRAWLRLRSLEPAWVRREVVNVPPDIDTLPVVSALSRFPMQSFYFQTGIGEPLCQEAPSILALQSIGSTSAYFTINGAQVRLGPPATLITLQSQSPTRIDVAVHAGVLETQDGRVAYEGQTLSAALDDDDRSVVGWADQARPVTPSEILLGIIAQEVYYNLAEPQIPTIPLLPATPQPVPYTPPAIPGGTSSSQGEDGSEADVEINQNFEFNQSYTTPSYAPPSSGLPSYPILPLYPLPQPQPQPQPQPPPQVPVPQYPTHPVTCPLGQTIVHIVRPGENLYRIALMYGTTVESIAAANNIPDIRLIYPDQRLIIPCAITMPSPTHPRAHAPQPQYPSRNRTSGPDCRIFRLESPLDVFPNGPVTFYWDALDGATGYRVNVYNERSQRVASFNTPASATSFTGDVSIGSIGPGFVFAWEVQAFFNDQLLCSTPWVTLIRAS